MTVTYASEVATTAGLGGFLRLLARWRGSIYKIVWLDLILFLGIYYALNLTYLFILDAQSKSYFLRIVTYCAQHSSKIPLSFVLGFYVSIIYNRWWSQFNTIPAPDNLAILIGASIKGQDERARIIRRTIVRYVCVTFTLVLTMVSPKVKRRFPTLTHFLDAGLITKDEKKIMEDLGVEYPTYSQYWLPLAWASNITTRARHEGIIREDSSTKGILDELNAFRTKCGGMLTYDWINVPLVYTQVVTLAVYSYFLVTVIGNQFTEVQSNHIDTIIFSFPFMPILEFFFFMGWLKVAEVLINPFGEDDDDFEVVWMIDRHLQVCYLLVDKIHQAHPKLMKDYYWSQTAPDSLPFTVGSQDYMCENQVQSTDKIEVKRRDQDLIIPESMAEHNYWFQKNKGKSKSDSSLWKTVNNIFHRKRHEGIRGYQLKKVSIEESDKDPIDNEINEYETAGPNHITIPILNRPDPNEYVEEFEKLRRERLEQQRQKLFKCVQLMKTNRRFDEKRIIEDIVK